MYKQFKKHKKIEESINDYIVEQLRIFCTNPKSSKVGDAFVELLKVGYFSRLITKNDSYGINYIKRLNDSIAFSTPIVNSMLMKIGESIAENYI